MLEDVLYQEFVYRRKVQGLPTDGYWLRYRFLSLLNEHKPGHLFQLSNGWLCGFLLRYRITEQMKTEKKGKSVEERLYLMKAFHLKLYYIQNVFDQVDPIWGAFPPECWWNMDQVPLSFCINLTRSLNPKGEPCWIAHLGPSGLEKRHFTLQLCIRGRGEQLMPADLLFKVGKSMFLIYVSISYAPDTYHRVKVRLLRRSYNFTRS